MAKITDDGQIDAPELTASLERQAKAQNEAAKATEEATELKEKENKITEKEDKKDVKRKKRRDTLDKANNKLLDKIKGSAQAHSSVTSTLDVMSDVIGNTAVQKLTLLAGAAGLVTTQTVKYGKALIDIQQTLPGFNQSIGQAFLDTGKLMLDMGLNLEDFSSVVKNNGLAFRKHRFEIAKATKENEATRIVLGLSRRAMAELTARATLLAQAQAGGTLTQEQVTKQTNDYIIALNEVALQTGRQADEVEDARIETAKGSLGFISTLTKQQAALFQAGQKILQTSGGEFSNLFGGLLSSADQATNDRAINAAQIDSRRVNIDIKTGKARFINQQKLDGAFQKLRIANRTKDIRLANEANATLAKFGIELGTTNKAVIQTAAGQGEFETSLGNASANFGKILDKTNKTLGEAGKLNVEAQRKQIAEAEKFAEANKKSVDIFSLLGRAGSAFGGEIGALLGAGGALAAGGLGGALAATMLPLALFAVALLAVALLLKKTFPDAVDTFIDDFILGKAKDDFEDAKKTTQKQKKLITDLAAKRIKAIKADDELSDAQRETAVAREKANATALEASIDSAKERGALEALKQSPTQLASTVQNADNTTLLGLGPVLGPALFAFKQAKNAFDAFTEPAVVPPPTLSSDGAPAKITTGGKAGRGSIALEAAARRSAPQTRNVTPSRLQAGRPRQVQQLENLGQPAKPQGETGGAPERSTMEEESLKHTILLDALVTAVKDNKDGGASGRTRSDIHAQTRAGG